MRKLILAALGAATMAVVPANAVVVRNFNLTLGADNAAFINGGAVAPNDYQDIFTFDTTGATGLWTYSASGTNTALFDPNGVLKSDLDFTSILFDGAPIVGSSVLPGLTSTFTTGLSKPLSAGVHTLSVFYTVAAGSTGNSALYSGTLQIASATPPVPEVATWAMFVGGFGLIGAGLRRKSQPNLIFA